MMLLLKLPLPLPSVVFEASAMVGLGEVLHTTPRAETAEAPWAVTLPPPVAAVAAMALMALVVTVGGPGVAKEISLP